MTSAISLKMMKLQQRHQQQQRWLSVLSRSMFPVGRRIHVFECSSVKNYDNKLPINRQLLFSQLSSYYSDISDELQIPPSIIFDPFESPSRKIIKRFKSSQSIQKPTKHQDFVSLNVSSKIGSGALKMTNNAANVDIMQEEGPTPTDHYIVGSAPISITHSPSAVVSNTSSLNGKEQKNKEIHGIFSTSEQANESTHTSNKIQGVDNQIKENRRPLTGLERIKRVPRSIKQIFYDLLLCKNILDASKTPFNAWTRKRSHRDHHYHHILKTMDYKDYLAQNSDVNSIIEVIPRRQQEQLRRFVVDVTTVVPVLILGIPPIIGYIPIIAAAFVPRQLLSRQFHNDYEIYHFAMIECKQRQEHFGDVSAMFWDFIRGSASRSIPKAAVSVQNESLSSIDEPANLQDDQREEEDEMDFAGPVLLQNITSLYSAFSNKFMFHNSNLLQSTPWTDTLFDDNIIAEQNIRGTAIVNECPSSSSSSKTKSNSYSSSMNHNHIISRGSSVGVSYHRAGTNANMLNQQHKYKHHEANHDPYYEERSIIDAFRKDDLIKLARAVGYNQFLPPLMGKTLTEWLAPTRAIRYWLLTTANILVNDDNMLIKEKHHWNNCCNLTDIEVLDACMMRNLPVFHDGVDDNNGESKLLSQSDMRTCLTNHLRMIETIKNELDYDFEKYPKDCFKLFTLFLPMIRHDLMNQNRTN